MEAGDVKMSIPDAKWAGQSTEHHAIGMSDRWYVSTPPNHPGLLALIYKLEQHMCFQHLVHQNPFYTLKIDKTFSFTPIRTLVDVDAVQ